MKSHNNLNNSINTGGGAFTATSSQIGTIHVQAGGASGDPSANGAAAVPRAELLGLLARIEKALGDAHDLPSDAREDLLDDARSAFKALNRPEPDFARAARRLASMREVLDGLAANASAAALNRLVREAEQIATAQT